MGNSATKALAILYKISTVAGSAAIDLNKLHDEFVVETTKAAEDGGISTGTAILFGDMTGVTLAAQRSLEFLASVSATAIEHLYKKGRPSEED